MCEDNTRPKTVVIIALLFTMGAVVTAVTDSSEEDSSSQTGNQEIQPVRHQTKYGREGQGYGKQGHAAQIQRFSGNGSLPISERNTRNSSSTRRTSSTSWRSGSSNTTTRPFQRPYNSTTEPVPQPITTSPSTERTQPFTELDPKVDYFPDDINSQESPRTAAEPTPCSLAVNELSTSNNEDFCAVTSQLIRELHMTRPYSRHPEPAFVVKRVDGKWQVFDFTFQLKAARSFVLAMERSPLYHGNDGHYEDY